MLGGPQTRLGPIICSSNFGAPGLLGRIQPVDLGGKFRQVLFGIVSVATSRGYIGISGPATVDINALDRIVLLRKMDGLNCLAHSDGGNPDAAERCYTPGTGPKDG